MERLISNQKLFTNIENRYPEVGSSLSLPDCVAHRPVRLILMRNVEKFRTLGEGSPRRL